MTDLNQFVEYHYQKVNNISKSWDEAFNAAKTKIIEKYDQKRNELKTKLFKQKSEELQTINDFRRNEFQLNEELTRISNLNINIETQREPKDMRRQHQLDAIFEETANDMKIVVNRHKDQIKQLETALNAIDKSDVGLKVSPTASALKTQQMTVTEKKNKSMSEDMNKLEVILKEIETKYKILEGVDKEGVERSLKAELVCNRDELRDRQKEMQRFSDKAMDIFRGND